MRHPLIASLLCARIGAGLTQPDVAAAVGVSVQTVQHWEAGNRRPGFDHLVAWCGFLDLDLTVQPARVEVAA